MVGVSLCRSQTSKHYGWDKLATPPHFTAHILQYQFHRLSTTHASLVMLSSIDAFIYCQWCSQSLSCVCTHIWFTHISHMSEVRAPDSVLTSLKFAKRPHHFRLSTPFFPFHPNLLLPQYFVTRHLSFHPNLYSYATAGRAPCGPRQTVERIRKNYTTGNQG